MPENGEEGMEKEQEHRFGLKDIAAFCVALYQILLPQLLIIFASIILAALILFWVWFK